MAHFAKLGLGNKVLAVHRVHNDIVTTEQAGADFLNNLHKTNDLWVQTSYNTYGGVHKLGGTPFRKNYAGKGYKYDKIRDAFIPTPKFNSWILNEDTCLWESPLPYPQTTTQNLTDDAGNPMNDRYYWHEAKRNWELIT